MSQSTPPNGAAISALVERFPWLDGHPVVDGLWPWARNFLPPEADFARQAGRFAAAGFTHVSLTAASGQETGPDALLRLGELTRQLREAGIAVAEDAASIEAQRAAGRLSASFHFQSATPFAASLDLVDAFRLAGVGRAILAYNEANIFADGCHEPRNAGLTAAGRSLVRRMTEVGMRVDLSHCGVRTSLDVLEMGLDPPPLFSHSNVRALLDHERNLTNDQIAAAAAAGCYIGINGVGMFLGAQRDVIPEAMARHAARLAERVGAERLGLGLDFMYLDGSDYGFYHGSRARWPRGYPEPPWSFCQPEQLSELVAALERTGFDRGEIAGLLGGNHLRLALPRQRGA